MQNNTTMKPLNQNKMNKEFVPYNEALILKELGFDEACFGEYRQWNGHVPWLQLYQDLDGCSTDPADYEYTLEAKAPTYSQAFRFFREKYGMYHHIWSEFYTTGINFNWQILWYLPQDEWKIGVISDGTMQYGDNGEYPTYEEAELGCLKKLIGIVKNKK